MEMTVAPQGAIPSTPILYVSFIYSCVGWWVQASVPSGWWMYVCPDATPSVAGPSYRLTCSY